MICWCTIHETNGMIYIYIYIWYMNGCSLWSQCAVNIPIHGSVLVFFRIRGSRVSFAPIRYFSWYKLETCPEWSRLWSSCNNINESSSTTTSRIIITAIFISMCLLCLGIRCLSAVWNPLRSLALINSPKDSFYVPELILGETTVQKWRHISFESLPVKRQVDPISGVL